MNSTPADKPGRYQHRSPPGNALALSRRQTARALGVRNATVADLVRRCLLREVPFGTQRRIPREDVERLAREGFTSEGERMPRRRTRSAGACDPEALLRLDLSTLAPRGG